MKKNGFTLVEVIGVITLLAVISLVAFPPIINQINSKKNQMKIALLENVKAAANIYISNNQKIYFSQTKSCVKISDLVDEDYLDDTIYSYDDFDINLVNAYAVIENNTIEISKNCTQEYKVYSNGTAIYLNPETGFICKKEDAISESGTKTGCMKWYVINDRNDSNQLTLLLDHNTTPLVAWNSTGGNTMKEVSASLTNDISSWNSKIKETARLITADEVAKVTGAYDTLSWTSDKMYADTPVVGTSISYFYFDGSFGTDKYWHTKVSDASNHSSYAWLFDNTNGCKNYGCLVEDSSNYGYWTSTLRSDNNTLAWRVFRFGFLGYCIVSETQSYGVRPVITISKSILN